MSTFADGVGMRNTTRHNTTHRRPPISAHRAAAPAAPQVVASSNKVDTLRRLVAAGQYHVNARYLAERIFKAAGLE